MTCHSGVPCGVSYILQKKTAASSYPPRVLWGEAMPHPRQQKTAGLTCPHHATLYHACYEVPIQLPHIFTNFHSLDSGRSPRALGQELQYGDLETHAQHTSWPKLWPRPWPSRMPATVFLWLLALGLQAGPERWEDSVEMHRPEASARTLTTDQWAFTKGTR